MVVNSIRLKVVILLLANMKLLIAFALIAGVLADEVQVVNLPRAASPVFSKPDIRPLIVPQHIIDAIALGRPVMRDAPSEDTIVAADEDLKVRFVDAPLDAPIEAVPQEFDEGIEVQFIDGPIDVAAPALEEIDAPEPVQIAEAPLPAFETAEISAPEAVKIKEPFMPAFEAMDDVAREAVEVIEPVMPAEDSAPGMNAPDAVMFVDAPLEVPAPVAEEIPAPDAVRIAEAPKPALETAEVAAPEQYVEAVKIAVPNFLGKQFADPRLR